MLIEDKMDFHSFWRGKWRRTSKRKFNLSKLEQKFGNWRILPTSLPTVTAYLYYTSVQMPSRMASGCGAIGSLVASDNSGRRFESCQIIHPIVIDQKDEINENEAKNGPLKNILICSNLTFRSSDLTVIGSD